MAACGGIEQIFEKPLSETPTFLESLSPWKHIKSMTPNIDDHSSFTEIFGELYFKENHVQSPSSISSSSSSSSSTTGEISTVDQEREKGYYLCSQRKRYGHNGSLSSDSLSLCTEGLGFESFDDVEEMLSHDLCNREWQHQDGDGDGERNVVRNYSHSENNHRNEAVRGASRGAFPPPISCIGKSGKPWVCFKSYREDGRFILKEIRIPTQEFLHACRHDGRLKLHFVHSDDDDEVVEQVDQDLVQLQQNEEQQQQQQQDRLQE